MAPIENPTAMEYRGIVECCSDPCRECRSAKSRHATVESYETPEEALAAGTRLARYEYGAKTHTVEVESRPAVPWAVVRLSDQVS